MSTSTVTPDIQNLITMILPKQTGIISMKPPRILIASHTGMPSRGERYVDPRVNITRYLLLFLGQKGWAEAILKEYEFDKDVTSVMEYAFGTGLEFSESLQPFGFGIWKPRSIRQINPRDRY
jgi:hypothetical protein